MLAVHSIHPTFTSLISFSLVSGSLVTLDSAGRHQRIEQCLSNTSQVRHDPQSSHVVTQLPDLNTKSNSPLRFVPSFNFQPSHSAGRQYSPLATLLDHDIGGIFGPHNALPLYSTSNRKPSGGSLSAVHGSHPSLFLLIISPQVVFFLPVFIFGLPSFLTLSASISIGGCPQLGLPGSFVFVSFHSSLFWVKPNLGRFRRWLCPKYTGRFQSVKLF